MRTHRLLTLTALGLVAAGGLFGCQHGSRHRWHRHHGPEDVARRVDWLLDRLDATPEQRQRLRPLATEIESEIAALRRRGNDLRQSVREQWSASQVDADELHRQVDAEIDALRQSLHRLIDQGVTVHDTLTVDQREQLARAAFRRHRHRHWRH